MLRLSACIAWLRALAKPISRVAVLQGAPHCLRMCWPACLPGGCCEGADRQLYITCSHVILR